MDNKGVPHTFGHGGVTVCWPVDDAVIHVCVVSHGGNVTVLAAAFPY